MFLFYRCLFNITKFATENDLTLAAMTWMYVKRDDFVNMYHKKPESEACAGREGYKEPCDDTSGAGRLNYWMGTLFIIVCVTIMCK